MRLVEMQQPADQAGYRVAVADGKLPVDRRRDVHQPVDGDDAALADHGAVGFEDAIVAVDGFGQFDGAAVGATCKGRHCTD